MPEASRGRKDDPSCRICYFKTVCPKRVKGTNLAIVDGRLCKDYSKMPAWWAGQTVRFPSQNELDHAVLWDPKNSH